MTARRSRRRFLIIRVTKNTDGRVRVQRVAQLGLRKRRRRCSEGQPVKRSIGQLSAPETGGHGKDCYFLHTEQSPATIVWKKPEARLCKFFQQQGWCGYGESCLFEHSAESYEQPVCQFFKDGYCAFGRKCVNAHVQEDGSVLSFACKYYQMGMCKYGSDCANSHDEEEEEAMMPWEYDAKLIGEPRLPVSEAAGICFYVDKDVTEILHGPEWAKVCTLGSGPMRVRIVGNVEDLGFCDDGACDPQYGIDLLWDGQGWKSMITIVKPLSRIEFSVVRLDQPDSHPGVLQGYKRTECHDARVFTWGAKHAVEAPAQGQVIMVELRAKHCAKNSTEIPDTRVLPRSELTAQAGGSLPSAPTHAGRQCCYVFDWLEGVVLNFCLYLPPAYKASHIDSCGGNGAPPEGGWPLCIFLHSMHGRLDGDNSLFYESDTPLRMLHGNERCPKYLRDNFIMLTPQCPTDYERPQGAGIWLRHGWYETSEYAPEMEAALLSLIETVCKSCHVDRNRIVLVGSSMGAYAALELAARQPNVFSALGLVAAHYDLDPMDPLVVKLTEPQALPLWFFHASNDVMCPHKEIELLVSKLRASSRAEIRFSSYEDTWSKQGHCADRVAFFAEAPGEVTQGEEFFTWLASQSVRRNSQL